MNQCPTGDSAFVRCMIWLVGFRACALEENPPLFLKET